MISPNIDEKKELKNNDNDKTKQTENGNLFPNSLIEEDYKKDQELLSEAIDNGLKNFQPDLFFESLINNLKNAKKLYGKTIIRELTGFDIDYIEKNIKINDFKNEIKKNISQRIKKLKEKKLIDNKGNITFKGMKLSALLRYYTELDKLKLKLGYGQKAKSEKGIIIDVERFSRTKHNFKELNIKKSIRLAIKRKHKELKPEDLLASIKEDKNNSNIIYALDISGSMKGNKIRMAKEAGIALIYKAINDNNNVGFISFNSKIVTKIKPKKDFEDIIISIGSQISTGETDLALPIEESITLFPKKGNKHLILITDVMPTKTKGKSINEDIFKAVSIAKNNKITISIVGINLDEKSKALAEKITLLSKGKFYNVKKLDNLDLLILEDYDTFK